MATKVAQRAGVSMMLLGSILQKQPSLAITYRLIEVQSGKILSTQRLSGFSSDKIFSLVDTLALLVKNDLKVSSNDLLDTKSVASVTTSSPEAYRSYLEGVQLNDKFYNSEAKAAFKKAIELDSNFAMAYFGLAMLSLEPDGAMKRNALIKAWQLSDRVTEKERLSIHSVYAARIEKDLAKSVSLLEELVQKYPHEQRAYLGLVSTLANQGNYEKALAVCLQALENDPRDGLAWNTLAYGYMMLNKHNEAMAAVDHYMQLSPALPNAYDSKGEICCAFGELDSALYWYQKAVSFKTDFPTTYKIGLVSLIKQDYTTAEKEFRLWGSTSDILQKANAENMLSIIPFHRGRMQESELILRRNLESFQAQKLQEPVNSVYFGLMLIAYQQHDYPALLDYAQKFSTEMKKSSGSIFYGRHTVALAYLKNGNTAMYSKLIDDIRQDLHEDNPNQKATLEYTLALGEFEKGNYAAFLEQYRKASQWLQPRHAPLFPVAVSLLKTGRAAEAIEEFQRIAIWAPIDFGDFSLSFFPVLEDWPTAAVKAHYWLGIAYEQQGEKTLAIGEYQEFLDIWKDADFISPELQDAKMRVAKLKGMAVR
jgi:tetratricopeptide (TPR) repeat protein